MTHSPLPWAMYANSLGGEVFIKKDGDLNGETICRGLNIGNADFITLACNNHKALLSIVMELHPTIKDDLMRAAVGNVIMKARGEI